MSWSSPDILQGYHLFPKNGAKAAKGWIAGFKRKHGLRNPRRRRNVDYDEAARELSIFIIGDKELYQKQAKRIVLNLAKKMANRTFDRAKSVKAFKSLADNGAKKYLWEFGGYSGRRPRNWSQIAGFGYFTPTSRREAAAMLLEHYMDQIQYEADLVAIKPKRRRNSGHVTKGVIYIDQKKDRTLQRHATFYFAVDGEIISMKDWLNSNVPVKSTQNISFTGSYAQDMMYKILLHKARKKIPFGRIMDLRRKKTFQTQMKWFYDNGIRVTKRGVSSKDLERRNPMSQHQALGAHAYFSPSGLQTMQALVPRRRRNARNKKLDIDLPNSNLIVIGVGSDINGNKVIRFKYPNKRGFSIQVYGDFLYDAWGALYSGREDALEQLETDVVSYIKSYGSAVQKKGLRTYGSLKRNPSRRHNARNKKLDIELPNSNLSVVGVGRDTNGNKVIRFSYPNKRAFSIQVYGDFLYDAWQALFSGRISLDDVYSLETDTVDYIKQFGSAAQKKGLRTYRRR
tara:strand:- start:857 stop:2392 length:1536 start_codon:yes stop_codon:yes gene_type:complete